jgi:hypothetical protein
MNARHRIIVYDSATLMPKLIVSQRIFVFVQVATPRCKIAADADVDARPCSVRHTSMASTPDLRTPEWPEHYLCWYHFISFLVFKSGWGKWLSISLHVSLCDLPCVLMQDISNAGKGVCFLTPTSAYELVFPFSAAPLSAYLSCTCPSHKTAVRLL